MTLENCAWCESPDQNLFHGLCGTCSFIRPDTLGLNQRQIPGPGDLEIYNDYLLPTRTLSDDERILYLKSLVSEEELPRIFLPRSRITWPEESALLWRGLREDLEAGKTPVPCSLPLPTGSRLEIYMDGKMQIVQQWRRRSIILRNNPPLIDIARQLEDQEKVKSVRYWDKLIMALSECVRTLREDEVPNGAWFRRHGWNGIDSVRNFGPFASGNEPPVFHFLSMLFDDFDYEEENPGTYLRRTPRAFEWLGEIGSKWLEILDHERYRKAGLFNTDVHPRLINLGNKLHLLILRNGSPTPIPVPEDASLLTRLIAIVLQPCNTFAHRMLEAIFWNFDSESEKWMPSDPDIRGARLLRSVVKGLGDRSSLDPINMHEHDSLGLLVRGDHSLGLCYSIYPSRAHGKMSISVALRPDDLSWGLESQEICIDLNNPQNCVPADHAISYLMGLANDSTSRTRINTLDHLIDCAETVLPNAPDGASVQERWRYVKFCYNQQDYDISYEDFDQVVNNYFEIDESLFNTEPILENQEDDF